MNWVNVHITNGCNFDCEICFENKNLANPTFLDKTKLLNFLKDYKADHVGFVGGEPLMHPDLPEIVQELKSLGIHTCVVTNGELLNTVDVYPNKFSIGIDNDDQIEVDKWLSDNQNNINDGVFSVEITITPTNVNKIDILVEKYRANNCIVNISVLAFWDRNSKVLDNITPEYRAKLNEYVGKISFFGDVEYLDDFYDQVFTKEYKCVAPLNIYSDGHLEWCDLENFPTGQTIDDYDLKTLIKPEFELKEQCKACNLRRTSNGL